MENLCEICGADCTGELCDDCTYRVASHDNSDIHDRVAKFDNTPYEIDEIKIAICHYYNCEPDDIMKSGRKQPYTQARHLYAYMLMRRFGMKQCSVAKILNLNHATTNYVCKKFDKKFESNLAVNKILHLLKY